MLSRSFFPLLAKCGELCNHNHGHSEKKGDNVHDSINIRRVHILCLVALQCFRDTSPKFSFKCSRNIGNRRIHERSDIDVNPFSLLDTSKTNTTNDGNEHEVGKYWLHINWWDYEPYDCSEHRLARFHNLCEADSPNTHSKHGAGMGNACKKANRNTRRDICCIEIRLLPHTSGPHDCTPYHANNKLCTGHKPMRVDHVGCFLVVDIVKRVARIPGDNQSNQLES
mmetsp:Transcript_27439/g.80717  ORF Transcript_27439/g.80717 Transcript_27439/m.80717 type:complete len:225 (-) Transcript_27439:239-913(-)